MSARKVIPLVTATVLLHLVVRANDIEPGKEYYTAIKAPNPIVLDGDLSEWSGAQVLADPRFSIPKGSGDAGTLVFFELYDDGGPGTAVWTGPDDQTSAVQIVYDDDNVYFGFVVTDEYHENAANSAWNGDSVQLMIADAARTNQVALYNYALGGVEGTLGDVIVMHEAGPGGTEAVVTRNGTTKRTIYEIKLPKASLALDTLAGGVRFGLGMAINDGDEEAPGQQGWGGLGAHALVFGKSPTETALVTLAMSNDIEPGKEYYTANPAPNAIVLDGSLAEWTGIPVLADPRFSVPKGSKRAGTPVLFELYDDGGPGTAVWTGPDDHTSAVQIVWDADNVYFGFVVTDEYHENAAASAWNGDSVQLMIASGPQTNQVALYNYALGGIEGALGDVIIMHEAGPGGTEAVVTRNGTTKRTTYEIKLPKESLALASLELGTQFGLGMAINDGDEEAPGQQGWGGLGAHALVFGKSPTETALVTLGIGGTGADLLFFSAINPTINGFTFRATDKGESIVDPDTAKLFIDGVEVPLTASPKNLDATDFTYLATEPLGPGDHTYLIEVTDTNGVTVTDTSTFRLVYTILTTSMKAVSVDTTKPGFIWRVFQNELYTPTSLAEAEQALAGELRDPFDNSILENFAWADEVGAALGAGVLDGTLYRFEIPGVVNLTADTASAPVGNFQPDEKMPGVLVADGVDAEIITFVDFPEGWVTMGVNSDDGFKAQVAYINNPTNGVLMGQFDGGRAAGDTTFPIFVEDAGVYPIRIVYQNGVAPGSIEIFTFKEDLTKVAINDTANGGLASYRAGVAPERPTEAPEFTGARVNANGSITIEWTGVGSLQRASALGGGWNNVSGASSPYTVTPSGSEPVYFYRLAQ
jgi:hypothetical protein